MKNTSPKKCKPCEGMGSPLSAEKINDALTKIPGWQVNTEQKAIYREFLMKNFMAAIRLINLVAQLAEDENHHPDIHLCGYRKLRIELSTHAVGGITQNDFILASKISLLPIELKQ